jgi:uncharacterized protein
MAKPRKTTSPRRAKTIFGLALLCMAALAIFIYQAKKQQVADQAGAPPRLTSFVQDSANIIDRDSRMAIEAELRAFDALGGPQLVVATRSSIDRAIEEEAISLARAWKIGRAGANNGVLLLFVEHDRKARIEVGYGLEGELTDARTRLIIANDIEPAMRSGDFTLAAQKGVSAILAVLHPGPLERAPQQTMGIGTLIGIGFFMLIATLVVIGVIQAILLAIPNVKARIARSPWFGWFARVRIIGGTSRGDDERRSTSSSASVGNGGSFGGGGSTG